MGPKRKDDGDIPESSQTPAAGIADGESSGDASLLPTRGGGTRISVAEGIHPQEPGEASAAFMEALRSTEQRSSGTTALHISSSFPWYPRPLSIPWLLPVVPGEDLMQQPGYAEEYIKSSKTMSPEDTAMMKRVIEDRNGWISMAQYIMRLFDDRTNSVQELKTELKEKAAVETQLRAEIARLTDNLESKRRKVATLHSKLQLVRRGQLRTLDVLRTGGKSVAVNLGSEWTDQADADAQEDCWACLVVPATTMISSCEHRCMCEDCFEDAKLAGDLFCCPVCDAPASVK